MKFLLITGAYRSGTSYLHKVFECNPKCQVLFQPAIKYFKLIDLSIRKKLKKKGFNNFPLGVMKIIIISVRCIMENHMWRLLNPGYLSIILARRQKR